MLSKSALEKAIRLADQIGGLECSSFGSAIERPLRQKTQKSIGKEAIFSVCVDIDEDGKFVFQQDKF